MKGELLGVAEHLNAAGARLKMIRQLAREDGLAWVDDAIAEVLDLDLREAAAKVAYMQSIVS